MHIGKKNDKCQYCIGLETENQILGECKEEKDLGVSTDSKLNLVVTVRKLLPKQTKL